MTDTDNTPWPAREPAPDDRVTETIERAKSYGPAREPNHPTERDGAGVWEGRHPPFVGGERTTHGARSPAVVGAVADAIEADLLDRAGQPASGVDWLDSPAFALALRAMCETEARRRLLTSWLDEAGLLDEDGHPRPAVRSLEAAERSLDRKLNDLGLTPKSAAALANTLRAAIALPIVNEVHPRLRDAAQRAQEARQVDHGPEVC